MVSHGWLPILVCLASHGLGMPKPSPEGEEARKVLGSSVVTSVSVIMDHGNGTKTYVSDGTTQPLPKPQRLIGSPADLMEPDRYEFYTFDETGDLVKRLMTLEEIQSLIAAGGDSEGIVGGPSMPPYYDQNLKTNGEQDQDQTLQTMDTEQNSDMPGVYKVVQNVQNVLKGELAASQAKPLSQIPDLSMPDAASSWSILFPNVLEDSLNSDINHLSEVLPEAEPTLKIRPPLQVTTTSNIPQRRPVTTTEALKFVDRLPTTTDSSLVIHYLPINAVPSKTHNKKPSKPSGGSYDKYKPPKETTTYKTTNQEATSAKPSSHVSTWSTLVTEPSSTTKQNLEAIKLNPQLSDSFSSMLNQVTENPSTVNDDKHTKPSSAMPNKYASTVKVTYQSIPLTTTMKVPNPVSTTTSSDNKYKNATKIQNKYKKPTDSVKLNVTKPVSSFGTTQYNRVSTGTSKPFKGNNVQTAGTKRPSQHEVTKQTEHISEFKNNGLQIQNLQQSQQSSSQKTSIPVRTTPYNANNVQIQASSPRTQLDNELKEYSENKEGSTNQVIETSTKTYNPSQYVNNQPVMVNRPVSSNTIQPYTTVTPFTFFTTKEDSIFSEPFMSNASTQIYNPTLYINNQPVLSTKPVQFVSPLRQSTTPLYYAMTETPQILSSQSYVSKPNPFLQNNYQTTPRTSQFSTNQVPISTDQTRNSTPSAVNKFEQLKTTVTNNSFDKNMQTIKIQANNRNGTTTSNELRNNMKPVKLTSQPPILEQVKNNDPSVPLKTESSVQKTKFTNTTIQYKNKVQLNNNQTKSATKGNLISQKVTAGNKTNTLLPPKSNLNRPSGNFSMSTKQSNNVTKGGLKSNSSSDIRENSMSMTRISQVNLALTESTPSNKLGTTTELSKNYSSTLVPISPTKNTINIEKNEAISKKPGFQNEKIKENVALNNKKNNATNTQKVNTNINKQNSTRNNVSNSTRAPENITRRTTNKTTETLKNASKVPLNTQNKGALKTSQTTSPKPFSSTQHSTNPSNQKYTPERISTEKINAMTDKPFWSTMSDRDNEISTPPESTIYIRVNTTTPQAPSTEKSTQPKITYTKYPESMSVKHQPSNPPIYSQKYTESTSVKQQQSTSSLYTQRYPESTSVKHHSSTTNSDYSQRYPESTSVKQQLTTNLEYTQRYPESTSVKQQLTTNVDYTQRYPESTSVKQQPTTNLDYTQTYPASTSVKQSSTVSDYTQKYPESTSVKQQQPTTNLDYTQRYPESTSVKQQSSTVSDYTKRYPESTSVKQQSSVTPEFSQTYPESTSAKQSSTISDYTQRYPESTSVKQQSSVIPDYSQRYPESTSVKQTSSVSGYSERYPESTSAKQQDYGPSYSESTSAMQQEYSPVSTSEKATSSYSPEYPHHLDHIVHDGISAVTNMLQYNSPVTPILEKNATESLSQKEAPIVVDDSSNLTTENTSTKDRITEISRQTTTETNYLEIEPNFANDENSKSTAASSQISGGSVATIPVMGETKHASTEAMQQLLNDLTSVTSDSTSPTSIESANLVNEDLEDSTGTVTLSLQDTGTTISSPPSTVTIDDVSSSITEATKLTTIFDEDQSRQGVTEQTTIQADETSSVLPDVEITTQQFKEQDAEIVNMSENNKTFEKIESTLEPVTSNTEMYTEITTEKIIDEKQSEEVGTTTFPTYESTITTDSSIDSELTTESDQNDVTTPIPTTIGMIELRTEAMDLAMEMSPILSSTTETLVTPETIPKHLNSTLVMSTSTVQTTATPVEEKVSNKPIVSETHSKLDHEDIKESEASKEPIESLKSASGGVAVKPATQKPSTVELHPPPHEHMGLEASVAYLGDDIKRFADLCNELAFKMWTSLTGKGMVSSRSLVLSPFAATSTLAMVFLGARGPTSGQMNDILRLDDMVSFNPHQVLQNVTDSVIHAKRNGIDTAAFVRELYSDKSKGKILDFYKERVQQYYDGHVEEIGFNIIGDVLRRRTNLLVKRQTQGKVPEYLRGSTLSLKPPLAAFTANIFQTECERASTEGRDGEMYFVVRPSTRQRRLVPVPAAVWRTGFTAGYEPSLDATAVSLNHGSDNTISSVYVLPGQQGQVAPGDGLARLEQRLIETSYRRGGWSRLLRSLLKRPGLELQLPRFSHRSVLNITATLQRMGLKDVFSAEKADLRGLNGIPNDLHLSDIIQVNTFSTCAEENIGARHHIETFPVSAQRVGREETFVPRPDVSLSNDAYSHLPLNLRPRQGRIPDAPRLRFDRPFLYLVRHNPTGMILYMGRFNPRLLA